jgi:cob(I)alamin adenosyltransferase
VPAAAQLHLARTICRRAERRVVTLGRQPGAHVAPPLLVYLNRLSDLLFVLARAVNRRAGVGDMPWRGR